MMIHRDESRSTIALEDRFVVQPAGHLWFRHDWSQEGELVPDGFKYTSDGNDQWLSDEEIRALVAPFERAYMESKQ
jgi:UDP-N-acetylglucosamine 4,6-dehydratase